MTHAPISSLGVISLAALALALSGCATPIRFAADWEQYKFDAPADRVTSDLSVTQAAQAVTQASRELDMSPIYQGDQLGFLSFSKPDKRASNTLWVLSVSISPKAPSGSIIRHRAFIYTIEPPIFAPRSFPADGPLNQDFKTALEVALAEVGR